MKISEKLGLGTVQFGLAYGISNKAGQTTSTEVTEILATAIASKIEVLDSASAYGDSENVLGQNELSSFKMVSKFMPPQNELIADQLGNSLKSLGLESLYGYLAHRPGEILKHPEQWEELQYLKQNGKVQKIGFSLNEPQELEQLLDQQFYPDLIQVPFNFFDRRFESTLRNLKNQGCEIHTRSTFLQGLFFINPNQLPDYFDEVKHRLGELQELEPLNGALLKFVLEMPFIDKVIIGVENHVQLKENIESIKNAPALPHLEESFSSNILIPSRWPKS